MVTHAWFAGYLLVTAFVMAKLEVQIEGDAGWAEALPTWRFENRITRALLGGRPVTGYHVWFHLLVVALLHAPFTVGTPWSPGVELRVLAFLILFWMLEDFFWFVVNPAFGLAAFRRDRVRWHRSSWWLFMPREYWFAAPVGVALYLLGGII